MLLHSILVLAFWLKSECALSKYEVLRIFTFIILMNKLEVNRRESMPAENSLWLSENEKEKIVIRSSIIIMDSCYRIANYVIVTMFSFVTSS